MRPQAVKDDEYSQGSIKSHKQCRMLLETMKKDEDSAIKYRVRLATIDTKAQL